jgi:hypothetical protein
MQFVHYPLTWAFLLVLAPLLIHLINLMRRRHVRWAAMDFLLQSYRRHQRSVWLKQLLLLLLRMLAVALVVAMLARLVTGKQWSLFFGSQTTHHYFLLDDSFSMSDRDSSGSAMDRAQRAIAHVTEQLLEQQTPQRVTLLRYSWASRSTSTAPSEADLNAVRVDASFAELLDKRQRGLEVTDLEVGPVAALQMTGQLLESAADEDPIVYLVSDFRRRDWSRPGEIREALQGLERRGARIHLIRCADRRNQNVAITELLPAEGVQASGVPLPMNVRVKNFGPQAAEQVQVKVHLQSFADQGGTAGAGGDAVEELPPLLIDQIAPGETAVRQAQVQFPSAGQHVVSAEVTSDAVMADNRRWCVLDLPAAVPVLICDGDDQQRNAFYLSAVFAPGRVRTGIRPVIQPENFLRDASDEELARFAAVYLLDVVRLEKRAADNLARYVQRGGGLACFLGPLGDPAFYRQWHAEGAGIFPLPCQGPAELPAGTGDGAPDVVANDHPIFRALVDEGGQSRPLARDIRVRRYWRVAADGSPGNPSTRVLARLRNGDPLVVRHNWGEGRVVAWLTSIAPDWNSWALNPTFPVVLLQLHAYLAAPRSDVPRRLAGSPIEMQLDAERYRPELEFLLPDAEHQATVPVTLAASRPEPDSPLLEFTIGRGADRPGRDGRTDRSGIYVVRPVTLEGVPETRRFAVNVSPTEGDMDLLPEAELAESLQPIRAQVYRADDVADLATGQEGFAWSQILAFLLVGLLLGEQALAYSASYHTTPGGKP